MFKLFGLFSISLFGGGGTAGNPVPGTGNELNVDSGQTEINADTGSAEVNKDT